MNFRSRLFFALTIALYFGPQDIFSQEVNASSSLVCGGADNCEVCVRDSTCFWCESKLLCKAYGAANKEVETKDCGEWKWKSCKSTKAPISIIISAAVSTGLIIGRYTTLC